MNKTSLAASLSGLVLLSGFTAAGAAAQSPWPTGAEITGHAVRVEAEGVVNTVYFDPGGNARIVSPSGREVPGRWFVENQSLCLETGARECWPYQAAFQTGVPVDLTSNCATASRWTALSTEPFGPPPETGRSGERG